MTELYRHFDADDKLLYVGISVSTLARLCQHRVESAWFSQIVRITIERFDTNELALAAERHAIETELPQYNVRHGTMQRQPSGVLHYKQVASMLNMSPQDVLDGKTGLHPLPNTNPPRFMRVLVLARIEELKA